MMRNIILFIAMLLLHASWGCSPDAQKSFSHFLGGLAADSPEEAAMHFINASGYSCEKVIYRSKVSYGTYEIRCLEKPDSDETIDYIVDSSNGVRVK